MFRTISNILDAPIDFDFDGEFVSLVHPIAHCYETNRVSTATSTILTRIDGSMKFGFYHEIGFKIDVIDLEKKSLALEIEDRTKCIEFIPADARTLVRRIVEDSYIRLIRRIEPNTIYRRTTTVNSLHKAMAKHHSLTAVIENEGYEIVDADTDGNGRLYWVMERVTPYRALTSRNERSKIES